MKTLIALIVVFLVGCVLTYFLNGKPDPGYERLWWAMIPLGGIGLCVPVIIYLAIKAIIG